MDQHLETISVADLDDDPALDDQDPGTSWHPRPDKVGARGADGHLVDLDDDQVLEHTAKPEAAAQPDAGVEPVSAESSAHSPDGQV